MIPTRSARKATSDTIDTLTRRVSVRDYTDEPLDAETLDTLLSAARRTSTSSNSQTYSFVVVRDSGIKRALAVITGDQRHVAECPVFVVVCADLTRVRQAAAAHGETLALNLEMSLVATLDAALAGQSLSLAAESIGLGTVMIGGMRNNPQEAADLLGLPDGVYAVFGLCLGWYNEKPTQKPRLPQESVVHFERYHDADEIDFSGYDSDLAAHYRSQGRDTPDAAWTGVITKKYSQKQRPHLRAALEKRGFQFD